MRMKLNDIIITEDFKMHMPINDKFHSKYSYYRKNRKLKDVIILNNKNELVDGYSCYLIAKAFDIEEVEVKLDKINNIENYNFQVIWKRQGERKEIIGSNITTKSGVVIGIIKSITQHRIYGKIKEEYKNLYLEENPSANFQIQK